jgi:hypothetical protein
MRDALDVYLDKHKVYPPSGNTNLVKELSRRNNTEAPFYFFEAHVLNDRGEVVDPWGRPVVYKNRIGMVIDGNTIDRRDKRAILLYSVGQNGIDEGGGGDDVTGDR